MQKPTSQKALKPKPQARSSATKPRQQAQRAKAAPVSLSTRTVSSMPVMKNNGKSFRVSHRELVLATVNGSTTFTVQSFLKLNPGLAATFPWLAPQANSWDQYTIHKLRVEYVPTAPTSTAGEVFLSPNYDPSDPVPTTEAQAANNAGTVSDSCWQRISLDMNVKGMMGLGPRKFVRPCNIAGDVKTFDVGTVAVCTNNQTGATAVGKLYLDYDIEFFLPNSDPSPVTVPSSSSFYKRTTNKTVTTAVAEKILWNQVVFDSLSLGTGATGTWTPPAGNYKLTAIVGCENTASESTSYLIFFAKNGVSTGLANAQSVTNAAEGTNDISQLICQEIFSMNGTDTMEIWITITGATGVLTYIGGQTTIAIELV